MSGFGLEEIGIPGRDYLKEALTSCTDPLKAIEDFQVIYYLDFLCKIRLQPNPRPKLNSKNLKYAPNTTFRLNDLEKL